MDSLILDLLEWLDARPRTYPQVMEAWRTSCPHVAVWEEATLRGFISHDQGDAAGSVVSVSPAGRLFLVQRRPAAPPPCGRLRATG
ncbi:MAG: hypothetical protein GEU92_15780 [Alphaproteobacteria bacterium]|nr:hypothetical protein [Alphaproteobacteria bacterium]